MGTHPICKCEKAHLKIFWKEYYTQKRISKRILLGELWYTWSMKRLSQSQKGTSNMKGFTLLEMLVVIVIISILLIVVLFNYRGVENRSILKNIAYEVALTVREAQSYGLGVKRYVPDGGDITFAKSYGVHVNKGNLESKSVYLFSDEDEDGLCEDCSAGACPGVRECQLALQLHSGAEIKDVCLKGLDYGFEDSVTNSTTEEKCFSGFNFDSVGITFKRPNPDARFRVSNDGAPDDFVRGGVSEGGTMTITLMNPKSPDYVQNIEVTSLGQIRVYGTDAI